MSPPVGPNMFFLLRIYHMSEAELQEEIDSDRDLNRQGFMGEEEFRVKHSMCRFARVLRRLDDEPVPELHYISVAFQVMSLLMGNQEDVAQRRAKERLRRHFPDQVRDT
jgi:hypothetical protein